MQTKHHIEISVDENVSLYCEKNINELNYNLIQNKMPYNFFLNSFD